MFVKSTYHAREEKFSYNPNKQFIEYFFYAGEEKFSKKAKAGGLLNKIYFLDEDTIFRLTNSSKEKDKIKLNDYNAIGRALKSLGKEVKEKCRKDGIDFYIKDSNSAEGYEGCRKLKDFEEKLLIKILRDR